MGPWAAGQNGSRLRRWSLGVAAALLAVPTACSSPVCGPALGTLYNRAAQSEDPPRNPVIVIPGILGSKLVDEPTGQLAWGAFGGGAADVSTDAGLRLLSLPMRAGAALRDLHDDVRPAGVLDRVRVDLFGLPIQLQAYVKILGTLGVGGYRDELLGRSGAVDYGGLHFTCFQFDYDWRRDNVENARRLGEFIRSRRAVVAEALAAKHPGWHGPVKFDIVAHSMGGLVARYFLMYGDADLPADGSPPPVTWAGAADVDKAILIGTPSAGSIEALNEMVNGAEFGPFLPVYSPALLGTMPSVYQLIARGRHGTLLADFDAARPTERRAVADVLSLELWERHHWGLLDPKQERALQALLPDVADPAERRRIAHEHLAKCLNRAARFQAALDRPAELPAGLKLYLFAGDAVETPAVASVDTHTGGVRIVEQAAGDGTVTRASALMDERLADGWRRGLVSPIPWTHVTFLFTNHIGLTQDPAFADNVLYLLLEQRPAARGAADAAPVGVSIGG